MSKNDQIKLGVAGGMLLLAAAILVWVYVIDADPPATKLEPADPGTMKPNTGTPGNARKK